MQLNFEFCRFRCGLSFILLRTIIVENGKWILRAFCWEPLKGRWTIAECSDFLKIIFKQLVSALDDHLIMFLSVGSRSQEAPQTLECAQALDAG